MKSHIDELAVFGGPPLFATPRPIGQLSTPDVENYLEVLKESFDARHLTNDGPVVRKLEKKLAAFHEVSHCICLANAGLGLMMLMQLFSGGKRGEVIMPAFSYRGLPHFAQWAGQMPCFCDVDPQTHFLGVKSVEKSITERTTSILGVCNFNDPGDIDGLTRIARNHAVPVFLDSVYAVGSTYKNKILGSFTDAEVYSLHATKLLNGFEGGYITTNDDELAQKLVWQRNFTIPGLRPCTVHFESIVGINAKLNEMHAAMAILSIDMIDDIIARNFQRFDAYRRGLETISGLSLLPYSQKEKVNYQMAVVEIDDKFPLNRDQMLTLLRAEGCGISPYYSPPLHLSEHCPPGLKVSDLPTTQNLAKKYLQLPVGELVSTEDIENICQLFFFAQKWDGEISARLKRKVS
ncbi:MAG: aminotransferase class I/II-fold pyridoxal phosphate-dependent enzyme [Desulfobacteraceae bacterium]|nr:MAG: aminotransferase class I/II-fold pyridoxal phosphate-dependent enzyme [Desulfobacteraceae bacterium]